MHSIRTIIAKHTHWLLILFLSACVSMFTIIIVIIGSFQTPPGFTYLAIGHYFADYFIYTQQIAQGMFGHWLVKNQFTTNDPVQTLIGWGQYLFIGRIASVFHLSPFVAYWVSVYILTFTLCLFMFVLIQRMLSNQSFSMHINAFLLSVFATPFVYISFLSHQVTITPYSFFYAPITIFQRIGGVPHHLSTTISMIGSLLLMADVLLYAQQKKWKKMGLTGILLGLLLLLALTFAPLQIITVMSGISIVSLWYIGRYFFIKKSKNRAGALMLYLFILCLCIVSAALVIRNHHGSQEIFKRVAAWEITQQYHPSLWELALSIGPILLLIPFGFQKYLSQTSPIRLLLLVFTGFSFLYFSTPLASFFGTFNQRFLSPIPYVLFGTFGVLGIQTISEFFSNKRAIRIGLITGFLLYFLMVSLSVLLSLKGIDQLGYMPTEFFTGVKVLNQYGDSKAVLTSPRRVLGLLVPCIVDRNVYLGRTLSTPDYEKKVGISDRFYLGVMDPEEVRKLFIDNTIGYVILSPIDLYPASNLKRYPFLKEVYTNGSVTIFQFQE